MSDKNLAKKLKEVERLKRENAKLKTTETPAPKESLAKLQQRAAAEVQQERHAPRMAHQKPSADFDVKDPKKVIKRLQPKIAAEVQQSRHPRVPEPKPNPDWSLKKPELAAPKSTPEAMAARAKTAKFQSKVKVKLLRAEPSTKPVTPKGPSLKEKASKFLSDRKAAKAAKAVAPKLGKIRTALRVGGALVRGTTAVGEAATVGMTAAEGVGAYRAGRALERQAAHAERKHGLKVTVKKPSLLRTMLDIPAAVSGEGPKIDVNVEYPKAPPLSAKAKKRLKSLGQM